MLWEYLFRVALKVVYDQPDAEALAQDCAQAALVRVHQRLPECRTPEAFRAWARRIASNLAIDALRRRKRLVPLDPTRPTPESGPDPLGTPAPLPEVRALARLELAELRRLLELAPISERSRRVVIGRYLDDVPDEVLAEEESELGEGDVLPSHLQVTRSKNVAKLRKWEPLRRFLER